MCGVGCGCGRGRDRVAPTRAHMCVVFLSSWRCQKKAVITGGAPSTPPPPARRPAGKR